MGRIPSKNLPIKSIASKPVPPWRKIIKHELPVKIVYKSFDYIKKQMSKIIVKIDL